MRKQKPECNRIILLTNKDEQDDKKNVILLFASPIKRRRRQNSTNLYLQGQKIRGYLKIVRNYRFHRVLENIDGDFTLKGVGETKGGAKETLGETSQKDPLNGLADNFIFKFFLGGGTG